MNNLKNLAKAIDKCLTLLRVEGKFRDEFMKFVDLAHSGFVIGLLKGFGVDIKTVDMVFNSLLHDNQVKDIAETVANIFECFSVDRFVGLDTEKELENLAVVMNEKKLFLAGIEFENDGEGAGPLQSDYAYKLRMDIDNTPVTLENRNRLWFPGADGNFELQMRYHRGFIQIQHLVDRAITKTVVDLENERLEREWMRTTTVAPATTASIWGDDDGFDLDTDDATEQPTTQAAETDVTANADDSDITLAGETEAQTTTSASQLTGNTGATPSSDTGNTVATPSNGTNSTDYSGKRRRKRSPQFSFFDLLGGGGGATKETTFPGRIELPTEEIYTKQFPYPKYRKDTFVTGLYLAQSIQLAFFFALIIQVSSAVRHRIWMRESGNSTVSAIRFSSDSIYSQFVKPLLNLADENYGLGENVGDDRLDSYDIRGDGHCFLVVRNHFIQRRHTADVELRSDFYIFDCFRILCDFILVSFWSNSCSFRRSISF